MQSEYKQKQVEALTLVESMKLEAQPIGSPWVGSSHANKKSVGKNIKTVDLDQATDEEALT